MMLRRGESGGAEPAKVELAVLLLYLSLGIGTLTDRLSVRLSACVGVSASKLLGPEVLDDAFDGHAADGAGVAPGFEGPGAAKATGDVSRFSVDEGRVPRRREADDAEGVAGAGGPVVLDSRVLRRSGGVVGGGLGLGRSRRSLRGRVKEQTR